MNPIFGRARGHVVTVHWAGGAAAEPSATRGAPSEHTSRDGPAVAGVPSVAVSSVPGAESGAS